MIRAAALAGSLLVAACAAPTPTVPPAAPLPQPGDTWTYRLHERGIGRAPAQSTYVVKVAASSAASIFDQASRDGAPPVDWVHRRGHYIGLQVLHEVHMRHARQGRGMGGDPASCGSFDALKVTVEQHWKLRPIPRAAHEEGVLRLTIWYSPQAKRAVKVASRLSGQGGRPPFDADFDLELTSYQLK